MILVDKMPLIVIIELNVAVTLRIELNSRQVLNYPLFRRIIFRYMKRGE